MLAIDSRCCLVSLRPACLCTHPLPSKPPWFAPRKASCRDADGPDDPPVLSRVPAGPREPPLELLRACRGEAPESRAAHEATARRTLAARRHASGRQPTRRALVRAGGAPLPGRPASAARVTLGRERRLGRAPALPSARMPCDSPSEPPSFFGRGTRRAGLAHRTRTTCACIECVDDSRAGRHAMASVSSRIGDWNRDRREDSRAVSAKLDERATQHARTPSAGSLRACGTAAAHPPGALRAGPRTHSAAACVGRTYACVNDAPRASELVECIAGCGSCTPPALRRHDPRRTVTGTCEAKRTHPRTLHPRSESGPACCPSPSVDGGPDLDAYGQGSVPRELCRRLVHSTAGRMGCHRIAGLRRWRCGSCSCVRPAKATARFLWGPPRRTAQS